MSKTETIGLNGRYTDATIYTTDVDEATVEQVQRVINHEAFCEPVAIMPDAHYGAGAVIGFTMPLGDRLAPNVVGKDIGCGMSAAKLTDATQQPMSTREWDTRIRERIPFGREVHDESSARTELLGLTDGTIDARLGKLLSHAGLDAPDSYDGYTDAYIDELCDRVGADRDYVCRGLGTLGGGNHFIEIAESASTGDLWVVVHSGSRYIGGAIASYWVEQAQENAADVSQYLDDEYVEYIDLSGDTREKAIRADHDGAAIGGVFDAISAARHRAAAESEDELAYLTGEAMAEYLVDMCFAQRYAATNRWLMLDAVSMALGRNLRDIVVSTHNFIDPMDGVIRKGATPAREGVRGVIPFNMSDGSLLVEGKGNDAWNNSAPHGAGRRMSRREAERTLSLGDFATSMADVFSTSVGESTLDEAPAAYKDTDTIEANITPTVEIVDRFDPVLNLKADGREVNGS